MAKDKMKCPQCGNEADIYMKEYRKYVYCVWCGMDKLLRLIGLDNKKE